MFLRRSCWLLALCLPAAVAQAAPTLVCGDLFLQHQRERNALLPVPKPLSRQQLLHSRRASTLPVTGTPLAPKFGDKAKFWGLDFTAASGTNGVIKHYRVLATLKQVTENAYIYVADDAPVNAHSIGQLAQTFEDRIRPLENKYFGTPATPGIDNDPRVTLLVMNIRSPGSANDPLGLNGVTVGGYFDDDSEYPNDDKHPYSNEREMVALNASLDVGSRMGLEVLAHEYQHLIHWNYDPGEEQWVNEGLSMVAPVVAGIGGGPESTLGTAIMAYGLDYDNSLTQWGDRGPDGVMSHYGAAGLFFTYLSEKYGGPETFYKIVHRPEHGMEGVLNGLNDAGYPVQLADLLSHWAAANLADDPTLGGSPSYYGYNSREERNVRASMEAMHELLPDLIPKLFQPGTQIKSFPARGSATLRPQAAHYIELTGTGTLSVSFDGSGHPFEVLVLEQKADATYQLYPLSLDAQSRTGSRKISGLGSSISTVYLIVTNVTEEGGGPAEYRYEASLE
jgi:hypothetical protein